MSRYPVSKEITCRVPKTSKWVDVDGGSVGQTGVVDHHLQPIPGGAHATRTTTPRDYSIEGSTPRAKHVVTPSSHPLRIEGCEDRESAAWPEPRDVTETKHVLGSLSLTTCQRPAQPVVGRPVVRMCELSDHRGVMVALDVGVLSPCLE